MTECTLSLRYRTLVRETNWTLQEETLRITCQNYSNLSPITILNGLAQFQLLGYTFQGYVTPQGHLRMGSGYGQGIEGQINNQGVFNAQGLGACAYNATWRRSS